MSSFHLILGVAVVFCFATGSIASVRSYRDTANSVLIAGLLGVTTIVALQLGEGWDTGFANAIWISILVTLLLFVAFGVIIQDARSLMALLMPYLAILGMLGLMFPEVTGRGLTKSIPVEWVLSHIILSILTYGLLTLTAVAGLSAMIQERALKSRMIGLYPSVLPTLARSEFFETILLRISLVVLALGLLTGMSVQFFTSGTLLVLDHKTIFSIAAFIVVVGMVLARQYIGLWGRRGARIAMAAWLLLTLAYPGVKLINFVIS